MMLRYLRFFFLFLLLCASVDHAVARPGGGESYDSGSDYSSSDSDDDGGSSSSSSSSYSYDDDDDDSSSGGSGDGGPLGIISLMLFIVFIVGAFSIASLRDYIAKIRNRKLEKLRRNFREHAPHFKQYTNANYERISPKEIHSRDAHYSETLLEDFALLLFHLICDADTPEAKRKLAPFLEAGLRKKLESFSPKALRREVVGNISVERRIRVKDVHFVEFHLEVNMELHSTSEHKFFATYLLTLCRGSMAQSLPLERMLSLNCPNCGAGSDFTDAGICEHCGEVVVDKGAQWKLFSLDQQQVIPLNAASGKKPSYAPERGTDTPTKIQSDLEERKRKWCNAHQLEKFSEEEKKFTARAGEIFQALYVAWSEDQWQNALPYTSDRLYESFAGYLDENRANGWRNRLDQLQVTRITLCKIEQDGPLDVFTARIFASCLDYYTNASGDLIAGSNATPREFSEYWKFIRSKESVETGQDQHCPNCHAPKDKIGRHAICGNCGTKVNAALFGWVLAEITQDEAYKG